MTIKTYSEILFELFCQKHNIVYEKIKEGTDVTPDYKVWFNGVLVYFEVKQLDMDDDYGIDTGNGISCHKRTVGSHIRRKIEGSRRQIQVGSKECSPSILLIYNNLDKMQMYGTEQHDFLAAMYGEMTLVFDRKEGKAVEYYYGKNKALDWNKNTSFSAVGFLRKNNSGSEIILYENAYSPRFKLDYSKVPDCIEVKRIILE